MGVPEIGVTPRRQARWTRIWSDRRILARQRASGRRRSVQRLRTGDLTRAGQPQHHAALPRDGVRLFAGRTPWHPDAHRIELLAALEAGNWTRYGELLTELDAKINNE